MANNDKNPFKTLRIGPDFVRGRSDEFIVDYLANLRRFYRRNLHPDVNPKGASEFRKMEEAFNTLDSESERKYWVSRFSNFGKKGTPEPVVIEEEMPHERQRDLLKYLREINLTPGSPFSFPFNFRNHILKIRDDVGAKFMHSNSQGSFIPPQAYAEYDLEFDAEGVPSVYPLNREEIDPYKVTPNPKGWTGGTTLASTVIRATNDNRTGQKISFAPKRIVGCISSDDLWRPKGEAARYALITGNQPKSEEYGKSLKGYSEEQFAAFLPYVKPQIIKGELIIATILDNRSELYFLILGQLIASRAI